MIRPVSDTIRRVAIVTVSSIALAACSAISTQETASLSGGNSLESTDRALARKNLQNALENSVSGRSVRWRNPASGASGTATPLKTWQTAQGTYCRRYSERINLASGKVVNRQGTACRSSSAVWKTT
ncbi:RT0821/Lpp0805 family surface protein [Roseibium sp.]|uniref:RT0821/Lpp0805 family surface protein n=1 Tax=Roseibium sp. TaxID=1936156 RepID=UPI0039F0BD6D